MRLGVLAAVPDLVGVVVGYGLSSGVFVGVWERVPVLVPLDDGVWDGEDDTVDVDDVVWDSEAEGVGEGVKSSFLGPEASPTRPSIDGSAVFDTMHCEGSGK